MSLPPGIYLIKNRETGYYIVPEEGTKSGTIVVTTNIGDEVPTEAKIAVSVDLSGLYTFKSDSDLSIADSGKKDSRGNRYLQWQDGEFKWSIRPAGPGLWNIKLPNEVQFAADNFQIGKNVILEPKGTASQTRWQFINAGA